ncbi:MAG: hypothetical protein IPL28_19905 [Chloroflexi bacterium]|nr:hypothetical protein [Chloroflexota bacterium]
MYLTNISLVVGEVALFVAVIGFNRLNVAAVAGMGRGGKAMKGSNFV